MTKRMLIDATHAEETRVVVLDGNRLEDFDIETAGKKQLKGNIYLAKVVRVEPSLQAAFVEYGGGRHGFLAFSEIHPDYYQIPVADRQRLLAMQEAEARAEEEAEDAAAAADDAAQVAQLGHENAGDPTDEDAPSDVATEPGGDMQVDAAEDEAEAEPELEAPADGAPDEPPLPLEEPASTQTQAAAIAQDFIVAREEVTESAATDAVEPVDGADMAPEAADSDPAEPPLELPEPGDDIALPEALIDPPGDAEPDAAAPAAAADDDDAGDEEPREARAPSRFMRSYKIQEVIRRRQILLIQVVKEERGTKGAALTTYISLAGRFSVLMPNSPRGGGISRKITSAGDRRRLKEVMTELQIPRGMGMIVRTAGANRPKAEIKRDCEYLLELWDSIRETTMASMAPALIHEEANLIKRAIRDNYSRDVDEVLVDGEVGWKAARDFMRMLMPAHARKVILWTDPQPLFARQQVEAQLDSMLVPTVQLRSGGYLVINQTEALVAIDVNSGRSTRERGIEETALKTNLEAADEVARQLRLRDLAGLIVIDFIDMESRRNNASVERRLKDALKDDRARIQVGSISSFGLMEMSRQRLRPSLAETSFVSCPHCGGTGLVRSTETSALAVLRAIEDEGAKRRAAAIVVHVAGAVALYILNHKRVRLAEIESRYGMGVEFAADDSLLPPQVRIDRVRAQLPGDAPPLATSPVRIAAAPPPEDDLVEEEEDEQDEEEEASDGRAPAAAAPEGETAEETRNRKRRRRRRGGRREDSPAPASADGEAPADPADADQPPLDLQPASAEPSEAPEDNAADTSEEARSRRRGRRGGRRRRRDTPDAATDASATAEHETEQPSSFDGPAPGYAGPTPADPFGGGDVFDIFELAEQAQAQRAATSPEPEHPPEMSSAPEPQAAAEPEPPASAVTAEPIAPELPLIPEAAEEDTYPVPPVHEPEVAAAAEPEPAPALAAEPTSTPAPAPTLVDAPAAEKKRGWWNR